MAHATQPWQALKEVEEVSDELMAGRLQLMICNRSTIKGADNWDITVAKSLFNK